MSFRVSTTKAIEFRSKLGFKQHDIILCKHQLMLMLTKTTKIFANEKVLLQRIVLRYNIDLYFPEHQLAAEVDSKGINKRKENEIEEKIKKELGCKFISINPDKKNLLILVLKFVKYGITSLNQLKNL